MCGIAGIVDFRRPIEPGLLGAMLDLMVHRGPDDAGRYDRGPFSIGMRRLSIIDVGGGHQPIANEDETVWVALNGEIYNFVELRADLEARGHRFRTKTDTEVLVHLYEEHGDRFPEKLNGMFGVAVWDTRRSRVVLARDHLGIKPLYWGVEDGRLLFASELKCLLQVLAAPPAVDRGAIGAYLHLGYIPRAGTPFRGLQKLPPGHRLVFTPERGAETQAYWRLADAFAARRELPPDRVAEEAGALLEDAVRLQLRSDVPLGTFLSGGLDSSSVTALAARRLPRVDTFGIGFEGHFFDETPYARAVAAHCGTRHHEQRLDPAMLLQHIERLAWHLDEPNSDPALLPSYLICRYAREHVKVALSGNGGDEVFAGYFRHFDPPPNATAADRFRRFVPAALRRAGLAALARVRPELARRLGRRLLPDNNVVGMAYWVDQAAPAALAEIAPWAAESWFATEWVQRVMDEVPGADWTNSRLYYDATTYMVDQILAMVDRSSMAVSLEVRVPFLDRRLVEFMAGIRGSSKIAGGAGKAVLQRIMRGRLPEEIFTRRKLGFGLPVIRWIRDPALKPWVEALPSGCLHREGFIQGERLRPYLEDEKRLADHSAFIWNLLMLELWVDRFLGGRRPAETAPAGTTS